MQYNPATDIEKIIVSEAEIETQVKRLGKMISADYADTDADLVCVGMLNGAAIFFSDLVRRIETCPIVFDFMRASSYGDGTVSSERVVIERDLSVDINGKHLLLIEDIVDSGITMKHILEYLRHKNPRPASIKVCALLSKPSRRRVEVPIDYLGLEVPDEFLIGYGMDYAKKYRNLPYIGVLKREIYDENVKR